MEPDVAKRAACYCQGVLTEEAHCSGRLHLLTHDGVLISCKMCPSDQPECFQMTTAIEFGHVVVPARYSTVCVPELLHTLVLLVIPLVIVRLPIEVMELMLVGLAPPDQPRAVSSLISYGIALTAYTRMRRHEKSAQKREHRRCIVTHCPSDSSGIQIFLCV